MNFYAIYDMTTGQKVTVVQAKDKDDLLDTWDYSDKYFIIMEYSDRSDIPERVAISA